ncbi:hypothetical protein ACWDX6_08245 [Streptomyces sp. NPDC003027]
MAIPARLSHLTIAWRPRHLSEPLTLRADHTADPRRLREPRDAATAIAAFEAGARARREALA